MEAGHDVPLSVNPGSDGEPVNEVDSFYCRGELVMHNKAEYRYIMALSRRGEKRMPIVEHIIAGGKQDEGSSAGGKFGDDDEDDEDQGPTIREYLHDRGVFFLLCPIRETPASSFAPRESFLDAGNGAGCKGPVWWCPCLDGERERERER